MVHLQGLAVSSTQPYSTATTADHTKVTSEFTADDQVPFPYIGTDESGKGDYFGPLVIAAVVLDEPDQKTLATLGVKDSKLLSNLRCQELAAKVRRVCGGKYQQVEIMPERYNELYEQFRHEGKNLNHLLAWGHARAIEGLLNRHMAQCVISDQFGDEQYLLSKLMEKGKSVQLRQMPRAERYTGVAAASILARDRFLSRLGQLGLQLGLSLPRGASKEVIDAGQRLIQQSGPDSLRKAAKVHFRTTSETLR